jgi:hypothetical protein
MGCYRWDFVSWSTKSAILRALRARILVSENDHDAQAVVVSPVFRYIGEMLGSPDPGARRASCSLLGDLARYECSIPPILEMRGCERLVTLLK